MKDFVVKFEHRVSATVVLVKVYALQDRNAAANAAALRIKEILLDPTAWIICTVTEEKSS